MALIQQITTTGSQATIDFQNIPGTFHSLILTGQARNTDAGTSVTAGRILVNNDTNDGNYGYPERIIGEAGVADGIGQSPSAKGPLQFAIPNNGNTAGKVAQVTFTIHSYASTAFFKWIESDYAAGWASTGSVGKYSSEWMNTAAITRLTVTTDGTAFVDGLVWTLYGIN